MIKWSGKRIVSLGLYRKITSQGYEHIPFILLYAVAVYFCYRTIGEQYNEALSKAENLEINIIDPQERLRKTAESFLTTATGSSNAAVVNTNTFTPAFFVPSQWIPGFWPSFSLGLIAIFHALLMLMQKWSISFACMVNYIHETDVSRATHARVKPQSHLGKEEMVKMETSLGGAIYFEFHRRKYLFDTKTARFEKVRCKVTHAVAHYTEWKGLPSSKLYFQLRELYGPNQFKMSSPSFTDLYVAQITSPFTVFQLFCAILWLLDEYWKYSLFNLFMICTFEATTVFTRLKSLATLKGMGNEARPIFVLREDSWTECSTEDIVPGDVFSLQKAKDDIIPCDSLIISGSAVVNESSLTGESVPQMKDGLVTIKKDTEEHVDIKGAHKAYTLFGGTRLMQVTGLTYSADDSEALETSQLISAPPDGGCVCYCVRTGFSSSQGKLVRMIENSTSSVSGDVRDTAFLLLFLLIFALSASGYVLYKGMQDGAKSRYQLLLHCILIVTSVIPPELPMQTALAVNSSLMTLMQMQIFCTEPFRVPVSGKVDTCVFDKTGTITTDELVAVGVVPPGVSFQTLKNAFLAALSSLDISSTHSSENRPALGFAPTIVASTAGMTQLKDATPEMFLILGACHSLILVDGKTTGDPLEVASMKAIRWEISPTAPDVCRPKPEVLAEKSILLCFKEVSTAIQHVKIEARHHFSSKLQRMSVIASLPGVDGGFALVKGSPEALQEMCIDVPEDFIHIASDLAKRGMRIIALGLRKLSATEVKICSESRCETEKDLIFAGFVAFTCRVRKDSADIIRQLRDGGCVVAMATGDAILTGVHVAREVGITTESKKSILILEADGSDFVWVDYENGLTRAAQFDQTSIETISKASDLCVSGTIITKALDHFPSLGALLHHFVVFARMRPDEKERILLAMKTAGRTTLMCGDGANDVGALKQADVGIALLSGFGDLNVTKTQVKSDATATMNGMPTQPKPILAENHEALYNALVIRDSEEDLARLSISDLHKKMRLIGVEPNDYPEAGTSSAIISVYLSKISQIAEEKKEFIRRIKLSKMTPQEQKAELVKEQKQMAQKKQVEFQIEFERLVKNGDSPLWATGKAIQNIYKSTNDEIAKRRQKEGTLEAHAGKMATLMDGFENLDTEGTELPMVKIGDASIAAPFTSKMPSIRSAVDIIRQGRCTLVTTIQMYQILALNCLISAYSLSVLHLDGIKYGDKQMTCLGILMSISFVTISRSKPLQKLSAVTPIKSVFHPALFFSILGQFSLHLTTLFTLVRESKKFSAQDHRPEFMKEFKPSLVNSVVFLVTAVQQVSVFVVNLKGPPFMSGLIDNAPLLWSLTCTFVGTFMCASEYIPQLNAWLQLEPFPSHSFRNMVLMYLALDVLGSFLWDRLMLGVYAFDILRASLDSTTKKDVYNIIVKLIWVFFIVRFVASQDYTDVFEEIEKATNSTTADIGIIAPVVAFRLGQNESEF